VLSQQTYIVLLFEGGLTFNIEGLRIIRMLWETLGVNEKPSLSTTWDVYGQSVSGPALNLFQLAHLLPETCIFRDLYHGKKDAYFTSGMD